MSLQIHVLDLGDLHIESSFLVLARNSGTLVRIPTFGLLILGGEAPLLVDTGYRSPEIMQRLNMVGIQSEEQHLENQLAKHGLGINDVRYVLHTHLHIDHAGQDEHFPMSTTVIINRRELEYSVSGLMGEQYPPEDMKHLIDRLHTPGALRLLDLELTGPEEIIPGVRCEAAGGHTGGSMNILVETAEGTACICGDVIYNVQYQVVEPFVEKLALEPAPTGNHGMNKREVKAAVKRALQFAFVLPAHDRPAKVEHGKVVGRLHDTVPGPVQPLESVQEIVVGKDTDGDRLE